MKAFQSKAKLRKGIAVGSALLVGAALGESTGDAERNLLTAAELTKIPDVSGPMRFTSGNTTGTSNTFPIQVAEQARRWTKFDAKKLRALAIKRAARTATAEEDRQFELLQRQRRANESVSPGEIMTEWRRRRFVGDLLEVLDRNVSFFKTEDQARLRTIRKTARS
jgi:hypothetical protein